MSCLSKCSLLASSLKTDRRCAAHDHPSSTFCSARDVHGSCGLLTRCLQSIADPAALGAAIRSHLPSDVTIFGAPRKVANSFNAKNAASSRRYEYILPTYVFARAPAPEPPADASTVDADAAAQPPPAFADDDEDMAGTCRPRSNRISALIIKCR